MKKLYPFLPAIVIAWCSAYMISCAPEACLEETNSFLKASFYSYATKLKVTPDSVTLFGLNMQANKIYNKTTQVQPALIPLNPSAGNCTFVFRINGITDTIQFIYSSFPHLISKECGYTFYHKLDNFSCSKNTIDSVYRSSDNITTLNEENLRLFY